MATDEKTTEPSLGLPLEMYDFIEQCKPYHLTIEDVLNLSVGQQLDVVIWDRNFEEYGIWERATSNKICRPEELFQHNRWTIVYKSNMEWTIISEGGGGESFDHPVHLNVQHLNTYMTWVGLENDGMVNIDHEIIKKGNRIPKGWTETHIHWKDFPKTTRAGWRGPIMLWEKLAKLPKVYYKEGHFPEESMTKTEEALSEASSDESTGQSEDKLTDESDKL